MEADYFCGLRFVDSPYHRELTLLYLLMEKFAIHDHLIGSLSLG